ncbi:MULTISPECIES: hypothetical protein [unclassified Gordonia (in: high G+C Gram-positive bacteria)]
MRTMTMVTQRSRRLGAGQAAVIRSRFLAPGDREWTNDGAANWVIGHVCGLAYSRLGAHDGDTGHLVLHNDSDSDLAVLSVPGTAGTEGTRFTYVPRGSARILPETELHIVQAERLNGHPVLIGEIIDDDPLPVQFLFDGPAPTLRCRDVRAC